MERKINALDAMSDKYFTEKALGPDRKQMDFIREVVLPNCRGPKVLELGAGNGDWTRKLADSGHQVTVVEGSSILAKHLRKIFENRVQVIHSLFEEWHPSETYDDIIAACVLEHVEDAKPFITRTRSWLSPAGRLHFVVPNALSLHRRVGLKMGLLSHSMELSPQELEVGHRRSYTTASFRKELESAGLEVPFIKGIFVKPLSSAQMIGWPEAILEGYNVLSDELPEYTAFLYARCTSQSKSHVHES